MPTYSYKCTHCDHAFDAYQSFTDPTLTECPVCHGRVRKVFSPIGVSFTGSGFYRNDSREAAKAHTGKKENAAAATGGDTASAGTGSATSTSTSGSDSGSSSAAGPSAASTSAAKPAAKPTSAPAA